MVEKLKLLFINMRPDLHHRSKSHVRRPALAMAVEVLSFIERRTAELVRSRDGDALSI
jgi:hypothetical protein